MITKIKLENVASYKSIATLETNKKINLLYGLNGTGKSILSNFLYDHGSSAYTNCSIEGLTDEEFLVYNLNFIHDYFYESEDLQGIFTLSKENKDAVEKIATAEKKKRNTEESRTKKTEKSSKLQEITIKKRQDAEDVTFNIKREFTGGDRILEFCLERLKRKEPLFNHINSVAKPVEKPKKTIESIKAEIEQHLFCKFRSFRTYTCTARSTEL